MDNKEILNFKNSIKNFTLDQLKAEAEKLRIGISKMMLESDLIIKAAIIDSLIQERTEDGETK